jgi:glycosyltransferase involved in cell wall biosynthesis
VERVAVKYGLPKDSPYILYLGRINRQKGSDLLPDLARELPGIKVVAAGPVGQFGLQEPSAIIDDLRSAGGTYLGAVPEADLRGLLSGAKALVLPTRQDEMFGMVLIEAGACGTPAIASDLGGIPEVLGDAGLVFPVGDTYELAERARRLVHDVALQRNLAEGALKNSQRFAWPNIAKAYDNVYVR